MTLTIPEQSVRTAEVADRPVPRASGPSLRALTAELHDGVAQELFAIRMTLDEVLASSDLSPSARDELHRVSAQLAGSCHTLRSVLMRWHQQSRRTPSKSVARLVRATVREFEAGHGIRGDVTVRGAGPEPGQASAQMLVRSVREALLNVAKHANASRAAVTLERGPHRWTVSVEDDGCGDPASVRCRTREPAGLSLGLSSLADHAASVSGGLTVGRSERLGGIILTVSVPVAKTLP